MEKTKGKTSLVIVIIMLMTFFFSLTLCEVSPLITNIISQTGWTLGQAGQLNAIVFFLMGAFAVVASPIMDVMGTKKTALLALALAAASHLVSFLCGDSFTVHYIRQFVYGCSWGIFFLVPGAVLNYWLPQESRAFFLGMRCAVDLGSCAVAYYIVLPIFHALGDNWQMTFTIIGFLAVIIFAVYAVFIPTTQEELDERAAKKAAKAAGTRQAPGIVRAAKSKQVWIICLCLVGMQWVYNIWSSYLPSFLELERGFTAEAASNMAGVMSVAGIVSGLGGGALSSALGRRKILTWPVLLIGLVGAFGSLYVTNTALLMFFSGCVGFGITGFMTAYTTIPGELPEAIGDVDFYNGAVAIIYAIAFMVTYIPPYIIDAFSAAGKTMQFSLTVLAIPLAFSCVVSFFIMETGPKGKLAQSWKAQM